MTLNRDKQQLKCSETPFIAHVLTPEGVKPDPSKVDAILKMERPNDVAAVRGLVGLELPAQVPKQALRTLRATEISSQGH